MGRSLQRQKLTAREGGYEPDKKEELRVHARGQAEAKSFLSFKRGEGRKKQKVEASGIEGREQRVENKEFIGS